jgi:hypothetical protein
VKYTIIHEILVSFDVDITRIYIYKCTVYGYIHEFIQTLETLHNGEELVFLYQLVEGHTSSSYACHVATQAGLPSTIVKRGTEVVRCFYYIQAFNFIGRNLQHCLNFDSFDSLLI